MVLFMLCSAVLVEWLLLKPCCVEMCGILFVMYGSSVFSSVLLSMREVRWVCIMLKFFFFFFSIGMLFVSFHM